MSVNKHEVMKLWVEQFLDGSKMAFENINAEPGFRALIPNFGEFTVRTDILGNKTKLYSFGFVGIETLDLIDTDTNNLDARQRVDDFNDWLVEQQNNENFPDFGEKVIRYKIIPLQNTANASQFFEDSGTIKYILTAQIEYVEKE